MNWLEISKLVHSGYLENDYDIVEMYSKVWEKLAEEFVSEDYKETYNAIKHGLRLQPNAIKELKINNMKFIGSNYGFQFGKKLIQPDGNFIMKYKIVNFEKELFEYYFEFFRMTIHNLKAFLSSVNVKGQVTVTQYGIYKDFFDNLMKRSIELKSLMSNDLL